MTDEVVNEDVKEHVMVAPPLSAGVFPDLTAPSIFFHGVTAHSVGSGGFSFSFEVQRPNQALDGSHVAERVHAGVLRCADVTALQQLKYSVDLLVLAAHKGSGCSTAN